MNPQELERRIDAAYGVLSNVKTSRDQRKSAAEELSNLNKLRGPRKVEQMEKERGLV